MKKVIKVIITNRIEKFYKIEMTAAQVDNLLVFIQDNKDSNVAYINIQKNFGDDMVTEIMETLNAFIAVTQSR